MRLIAAVSIAALAAVSVALASGSHLVTQKSIGKGKLGQNRTAYTKAYGKSKSVENLEGGLTRLNYAGHVAVYFTTGKNSGRYIVASDASFKTSKGVGPCSKAATVKSAYRSAVRVSLAGGEYAYRVGGTLWFEIESSKVAAVALGVDKQAAWIAANTLACGS